MICYTGLKVLGPDPEVFPNNSNFRSHYKEFVVHGYRSSYEAIQCKFPLADSNRVLLDWSTGFVDGMTKIILCLCIIGFCEELEFTDEQLRDPDLRRTLDSFGAFRCSYQHFDNQGHHFLNAISVPALLQVVGFVSFRQGGCSFPSLFLLFVIAPCHAKKSGLSLWRRPPQPRFSWWQVWAMQLTWREGGAQSWR